MAVYINRSQAIAERLVKLRDYLHTNASPAHAVKANDMLAYLEREGHKVEIKTLYKDIETLRNFFGVDIDYEGRQKGYILKNPPFEPFELRMIVNSIQAAKFITQQEADRLTDKIMRLADRYTRPSLARRTLVPNRVRTINEDAMKGLDTIYEAIAKDKKISYKYFKYTLPGNNKPKEYQSVDNSKIITASPYRVVWQDDKFWVYAILKIPKYDWYEETIALDSDDENEEDDEVAVEDMDFYCDDMDDTGQYVYDLSMLDLELMEQVKIVEENREGQATAQKYLPNENNGSVSVLTKKTKLKINNMYISDIVTKFGNEVSISPGGHTFFIATINEEVTPELYLWTRKFPLPIEIIYPESAEADLKSFILNLTNDDDPSVQLIKEVFQLEEDFLSLKEERFSGPSTSHDCK